MFDESPDDDDPQLGILPEPSAELAAIWAQEDARIEDPVFFAGEVAKMLAQGPIEPDDHHGAWIADLGVAAGSAGLALWVDSLDPATLADFELVEQVAAYERVASWAKARQLAAIEVLARRGSMNPSWPVPVSQPCVASEEVAARLGASRQAGRELVEASRLFAGSLMATGEALGSGDLDWGKAKIVIAALKKVPWQVAQTVEDVVLPGAAERTPTQLRADLQKALVAVDPADAEQRTARAVDDRRVCRPTVLPDGMAGIWSVLPAEIAIAIDTALTDAARNAKCAGDDRTIDQLRADAYSGTLLGDDGHTCGDRRRTDANAMTTGVAADDAAWTSEGSEPSTGPGAGAVPGDSRCPGSTCGAGGGLAGRVRIDVTVSLTTLLGLDEVPGQLAGYGAITAQTARRLAANGTWRRLVTDPRTGTVLDVGRTRYHPPDDLTEIIRARDPFCLSPICSAASRNCDLDHREPFHADGSGGATSAENLGPLCRREHLLKTHAGWRLGREPNSGTITWTTPTGHTYTYKSPPPPGHEHLPQVEPEVRQSQEDQPDPVPERDTEAGDPPPF